MRAERIFARTGAKVKRVFVRGQSDVTAETPRPGPTPKEPERSE
jgi:hypothetical protein